MEKRTIALLLIFLLAIPMVYAVESKEIYDINDRQTKEIKVYIDNKFNSATTEVQKFVDTLFQTFDKRMSDLTKTFVLQMAVILFFTHLLSNALVVLLKNKFEKDLMTYRYNILLEKEKDLYKREQDLIQDNNKIRRNLEKRRKDALGLTPLPMPEVKQESQAEDSSLGNAPKPKKNRFKKFKRKPKKKRDFMAGVK